MFRFSEPVEGSFGAIRVFDRAGARVDAGEVFHPGGQGPELATKLKPGLGQGQLHRHLPRDLGRQPPGLGRPRVLLREGDRDRRDGLRAALAAGQRRRRDPVRVRRGARRPVRVDRDRGRDRLLPARDLAAGAGARGRREPQWREASERFAAGARTALLLAVLAGVLSGMAGIVFQGATAAGVSFWSALDSQIIGDVLDTRFGTVWGIRILVWLGLGAVLLGALSAARRPVLRPASVGATGLAPARFGRLTLALLALPLGFLVISPALAGHASLEEPAGVLVPANAIHVLAMSIWVAGLVLLLFVLPRATRLLEAPDRTRLLAATLARFSPIAFASRDRAARHGPAAVVVPGRRSWTSCSTRPSGGRR